MHDRLEIGSTKNARCAHKIGPLPGLVIEYNPPSATWNTYMLGLDWPERLALVLSHILDAAIWLDPNVPGVNTWRVARQ